MAKGVFLAPSFCHWTNSHSMTATKMTAFVTKCP